MRSRAVNDLKEADSGAIPVEGSTVDGRGR